MPAPFTPEEAAAELGCAASTLRKRSQEFGGYRIGRVLRFDREKIFALKRTTADPLRQPVKTVADLSEAVEALHTTVRYNQQQFERERAALIERIEKLEARAA